MNRIVAFEKINGKNIFTILSQPDQSTKKKIVIMAHGFRGNSTGPARTFVNFTQLLTKNGFSTFRFDQPHCGTSDGDFLQVSFKEWVKTIIYFANKFLDDGYEVALLGQSMGATATVIAASNKALASRIKCILLWVPDPESDFNKKKDVLAEEEGELYNTSFWREAKEMNFFTALDEYKGGIHLVYGEIDKYVSSALRKKTIDAIKKKNQQCIILKGQDHSPWKFSMSNKVFEEELAILNKNM